MAEKATMVKAAQRRFKGKYAGPDKYKGVVPSHLAKKYKGKYFGKEGDKGTNPPLASKKPGPLPHPGKFTTPAFRGIIKPINKKKSKKPPSTNPDIRHIGSDPTKFYAL